MVSRAAFLLLVVATLVTPAPARGRAPDPLAVARRHYAEGKLEAAMNAAKQAATNPSTASSARLVMGRIHLERYRQMTAADDLDGALEPGQVHRPVQLGNRRGEVFAGDAGGRGHPQRS